MLHFTKKRKATVISHVYNEEWIIKHWLKHHIKLFDHGLIIDYSSTDRTVDLIKQIAPGWDVVRSKNKMFDSELCDVEVMEIEAGFQGWKMVLNCTEFLMTNDLASHIEKWERNGIDMIQTTGYQINDTIEESSCEFDDDKPLALQRFHGKIDPYRHRIIHSRKTGRYMIGRHYATPGVKKNPHIDSISSGIPRTEDLILFWYRFAPLGRQIPRKLQISPMVPERDKALGYSWHHIGLTEEVLLERWSKELKSCSNLLEDEMVAKHIKSVRDLYGN